MADNSRGPMFDPVRDSVASVDTRSAPRRDSSHVSTRELGAAITHGRPLPASRASSRASSEMDVDDAQLPRSMENLRRGEQPDALRMRSGPDAAGLLETRVLEPATASHLFTNRSQPSPEIPTDATFPAPSRNDPRGVGSNDQGIYSAVRPSLETRQAGVQADLFGTSRGTLTGDGPADVASIHQLPRHYRTIIPAPERRPRRESLELVRTQNTPLGVGGVNACRLTAPSLGPMALDTIPLGQTSPEHASSAESSLPQHDSREPWRMSKYGTKPDSSEDRRVFPIPRPKDEIIKGMKKEVQRTLEAYKIEWNDWLSRSPTHFETLHSMLRSFSMTVEAYYRMSDPETVSSLQYSVSKVSAEANYFSRKKRRDMRLGRTQKDGDSTKRPRGPDENGHYAVFTAVEPLQGATARRPCRSRAPWSRLFPPEVAMEEPSSPSSLWQRVSRREAVVVGGIENRERSERAPI